MLTRIATGLILILAILVFTQGLASASPLQITNNATSQGRPDVFGDTIVWKDFRAGNYDIYRYDIASGSEYEVAEGPAYQNLPATNGLVIVWQDDRNGSNDIFMKDLLLGFEQTLASGPGNQGIVDISGNKLVYVDDSSGSNDIYALDLPTRAKTLIAGGPSNQWQPRISGSRIVWQDDRNGKWDIYMYDLDSGTEQPVASGPGEHAVCDIDGDRVVWQEHNNGQYDIHMKDLGSDVVQAMQAITADAAYQSSPRISGDLAVWEDFRNDPDPGDTYYDYDIYMHDFTAGSESKLAGGPTIQARPAIDRETVVWEDTAAGNYDIWMTTVPDVTPPTFSQLVPEDGSVACPTTAIEASIDDNRTGIDTQSVSLLVDGEDVTAAAAVTENSVSYQPDASGGGQHTVSLTAADMAGNSRTQEWQYSTGVPRLSIASLVSYWATVSDYQNRLLSVRFSVKNDPVAADAAGVTIVASPSSVGVIATGLPSAPYDIASGEVKDVVNKYLIPPAVTQFKTNVFMSCSDDCGGQYYFPGPPPA